MDKLGILHAPLVGHSMGGTVALSFAIKYPERVKKVVIVGSPIVGNSLSPLLRLAGYSPIAFAVYNQPALLRTGIRLFSPLITRPYQDWYKKQAEDLSSTTLESFLTSIASLRKTDLRPELHKIKVPVLGIFGTKDNIVHPKQYIPLQEGCPQAQIELMENNRHFPMLDDPERFIEILDQFLAQPINQQANV